MFLPASMNRKDGSLDLSFLDDALMGAGREMVPVDAFWDHYVAELGHRSKRQAVDQGPGAATTARHGSVQTNSLVVRSAARKVHLASQVLPPLGPHAPLQQRPGHQARQQRQA